jgi:hypothetical protein
MKTKINNKYFGISILFLIMLIPVISAFGISSQYTTSNPIIVAPGEKVNVNMALMTSPEETNAKVGLELLGNGNGIATVSESEYSISKDKPATIAIKLIIPNNAVNNTEYMVTLRFSDLAPTATGGMIGFAKRSEVSFKVVVQEKPAQENENQSLGIGWIILAIILIIAIIAIIYFIVKGKKK